MAQQVDDLSQPVQTADGVVPKHSFNWTRLIITIVLVVLTAGALGGGVWYYMNQQSLKAEDAKNKEVEQLQKQIDELKKPSAATTATTATADPTATWNTYSNANYGFSIKYLPSYAYRESTATPFSISFQKADDKSLEPFGYGMTVYSIAPMTLNNWVDTVKAKEGEPSVGSGSLKECKVNGNNGFCYSSSGMLGAFNNYLVQSKDGKYAIELALPKEGNLGFSVDNLLSSFKLL